MAVFIIRPPPQSFDAAIPLLTEVKGPHHRCQNIQSGTNAIDIMTVKIQENVRQMLLFRHLVGTTD